MENEREGIEQILFRLLDYRAEQNVNHDSLLVMLSLLNLAGLVNALNRDKTAASPAAGNNNLQSLLPLLSIAAGGLGGGAGGQVNPAALMSMLGGVLGGGQKEMAGIKDLTGIFDMLETFRGLSAPVQRAPAPKPAQREINLDRKKQTEIKTVKNTQHMQRGRTANENKVSAHERSAQERFAQERSTDENKELERKRSATDENKVLEWHFGGKVQ